MWKYEGTDSSITSFLPSCLPSVLPSPYFSQATHPLGFSHETARGLVFSLRFIVIHSHEHTGILHRHFSRMLEVSVVPNMEEQPGI